MAFKLLRVMGALRADLALEARQQAVPTPEETTAAAATIIITLLMTMVAITITKRTLVASCPEVAVENRVRSVPTTTKTLWIMQIEFR